MKIFNKNEVLKNAGRVMFFDAQGFRGVVMQMLFVEKDGVIIKYRDNRDESLTKINIVDYAEWDELRERVNPTKQL